MVNCAVPGCKSSRNINPHKYTFHVFPVNTDLREKWIRMVNRDNWTPRKFSTICSKHFEPKCFVGNKTSRIVKLRVGSVPTLHMPIESRAVCEQTSYVCIDIQGSPSSSTRKISGPDHRNAIKRCLNVKQEEFNNEPLEKRVNNNLEFYQSTVQTIQACRICLAMDRRLVKLEDTSMRQLYQDVTGYTILPSDVLQQVCWECAAKLKTCVEVRRKAINSHNLLLCIMQTRQITVPVLESIDRKANKLQSTLAQKYYCFNYPDEEFGKEDRYECTEHDYIDPNTVECKVEKIDDTEETVQESQLMLEVLPMDIADVNYNTGAQESVKAEPLELGVWYLGQSGVTDFGSEEDANVKDNIVTEEERVSEEEIEKPQSQADTTIKRADKLILERNSLDINEALFNIEHYNTLEERKAAWDTRKFAPKYLECALKCENCYFGFESEERFKRHMARHSGAFGNFECAICKLRFKRKRYLLLHCKLHFQKFYCKECDYNTTSKTAAKIHEAFHKGKVYECPDCDLIIRNPSTYKAHLRANHCDYVCTSCGESFVSEHGLSRHKMRQNHYGPVPENGPYCKVCDVRFESTDALDVHSIKHKATPAGPNPVKKPRYHRLTSRTTKSVYVCVKCGFSFMTERGLNDHQTKLHDEPQTEGGHLCSVCDLRFDSKKAMETHLKVSLVHVKPHPLDEKIEMADRNNKQYKRRDVIKCELCDAELATGRKYRAHFLTKHPGKTQTQYKSIRPYMCDQCGRRFRSVSCLEDHKFEHSEEIEFKCSECGKIFKSESRLLLHAKFHGNENRYACDICGKTFNRLNNMFKHQVVHKGLKRFQCEICGKRFHYNHLKNTHVRYVHMKVPMPKRLRPRRRKTVKASKSKAEQHSDDQQLVSD